MDREDLGAIVLRAREGDQRAFSNLYNHVHPAITNFLRGRGVAPNDAKDIAHQAMAKAFLKLQELRYPPTFSEWAHRIAINVYINNLRKTKRQSSQGLSFVARDDGLADLIVSIPCDGGNPEVLLRQKELNMYVARIIAGMPLVYGQALRFRMQSYDEQESARLLGIPVGTFKSRVARGRKILANELLKLYPDVQRHAAKYRYS